MLCVENQVSKACHRQGLQRRNLKTVEELPGVVPMLLCRGAQPLPGQVSAAGRGAGS